jgi:DNA-binding response OmpR family regulator
MTFLIVEDNEKRAKELKEYLQSKYIKILTAEHGYDAMQVLKTENVDLILSDCNMPYMDGFILAKNVKAQQKTPFLLFSSRFIPQDTQELARDLGVDKFITKTDIRGIGDEALLYVKTQ